MSGPALPESTALLAVDTGGTFTDLVLLREGAVTTLKVPSTPDDPAQAVLDGARRILGGESASVLLHGSTVATNALLERRGAKVVLVTNAGFEDVIEIGRQNRPQLYALVGHRPPPLVDRDDRLGIAGRVGPDGAEIEPLDPEQLATLADTIRDRGPEAIALSLLHAYANGAHERAVADVLARVGLPLSVSSELVPEFREYERTSTAVINAYVAPLMSRYLGRLSQEAPASRVSIMGSNGGTLPVERARREPVHTVLSGPAGGVIGALTWAHRAGHDSVITFDMGGTSTDVSLCPGRPLRTRELEIAGQPAAIPVIDIHTVGAGGGSLARVDAGGALRVGPQSAGARPGPVCYGRGGAGVTVTDAHVWLGRLPADGFLGGFVELNRAAVEAPLRQIAGSLGITLDAAADGILSVANTAMERALRVISVERGYDPVDFAVLAFGGAGGLHVAELSERLGAPRAIVPPDPGLLSAYGMLASRETREVSRTVMIDSEDDRMTERLAEAFATLEHAARSEMVSEGATPDLLISERWVAARYRGQSFELDVPAQGWLERFHRSHRERYGYERPETSVEAVTLRVMVSSPAPRIEVPVLAAADTPPPTQAVEIVIGGRPTPAARVQRESLRAGHLLEGPLIVQEYSGTTWVPPEWQVEVDDPGCLHLTPVR